MNSALVLDNRLSALDDSFVNREVSEKSTNPAWPAWKQLLEDLADAPIRLDSVNLAHKTLGDAGAQRLAELLRSRLSGIRSLDVRLVLDCMVMHFCDFLNQETFSTVAPQLCQVVPKR
jgi:hypothetical protein